jgi:hypothetical protein
MNLLRSLRRPTIDNDGVMAVVYGYYLDPQPQRALAAFERLVEGGIADQGINEIASTAWVFGRIAGRTPEIQGPVRRALDRRRASASPFGRIVLETAQAGEGAGQHLLTRPLTSANDIALLGAEAVVTGSFDAFSRMIDAVGTSDVIRLHLEQWLHGEKREPGVPSVEEGIEVLATDYHIIVQADPPSVLTLSDCDLMVMVRKPITVTVRSAAAATGVGPPRPTRRLLPGVELGASDEERIRIKVSASLALSEALNEREGLADHVRLELSRRHDPRVRIDLLEVLAGYELPKFRFAEGIELLEKVLQIDPHRCDLETLLERLRRDPIAAITDSQ